MSERQLLFEGFPHCQSPGLGSLRADASLCGAACSDISGIMVQELALGWIHKTSTYASSFGGIA